MICDTKCHTLHQVDCLVLLMMGLLLTTARPRGNMPQAGLMQDCSTACQTQVP